MDINRYAPKGRIEAKHLLSLQNLCTEDIFEILLLAKKIKMRVKAREKLTSLENKTVAFMHKSSRFKAPYELAVKKLGGVTAQLPAGNEFEKGIDYADVINVYKSYGVSLIVADEKREDVLKYLANKSVLPIINCTEGLINPCQALADLFTLWEKKGKLSGLKFCVICDGNSVKGSEINAFFKAGVSVTAVCPKDATLSDEEIAIASQFEDLFVTDNITLGLKGADAITTRFSHENAQKYSDYKLTHTTMSFANEDALFMHTLPVVDDAVSGDVVYGNSSAVFNEAENLIYVQQALVLLLIAKG